MRLVVVSLGCNMGDRETLIACMRSALHETLLPPVLMSCCMETEPVDVTQPQPWYLNQVVSGGYNGTCRELLNACRQIENRLGRRRRGDRSPRTADIDILLFGNDMVAEDDLRIPHRALTQRRFLLEGLAEIHADLTVPGTGATVAQLLAAMDATVKNQAIRFRRSSAAD